MGLQKVHSKQGSIICTQRFQIPDTAPKNPKIRFYYFGRFSHALHSESRLPEDLCNQCWFLLIDSKETRDLISVDEKSWKWVIHYRVLTCFRQSLPPFRPSFMHSNCLSVFPSGAREIWIFLLLSWTLPKRRQRRFTTGHFFKIQNCIFIKSCPIFIKIAHKKHKRSYFHILSKFIF